MKITISLLLFLIIVDMFLFKHEIGECLIFFFFLNVCQS
jgi:hypothetical protein